MEMVDEGTYVNTVAKYRDGVYVCMPLVEVKEEPTRRPVRKLIWCVRVKGVRHRTSLGVASLQ